MADAFSQLQNRWSDLTGHNVKPKCQEGYLEQGNDESQKETPRSSHEGNRQEEHNLPEATELLWEEDPANAYNWSKASRIYHTAVPCKAAIPHPASNSR